MNNIVRIRTDRRRELKRTLVDYRETVLVKRYPQTLREHGILRRNMIDAILENMPESGVEFMKLIPAYLLRATDRDQLRKEIEMICRYVRRH